MLQTVLACACMQQVSTETDLKAARYKMLGITMDTTLKFAAPEASDTAVSKYLTNR